MMVSTLLHLLPLNQYNDPHNSEYYYPHFADRESELWDQELHSDAAIRDPLQGLKYIRVDFFHLTRNLEVSGCRQTAAQRCPVSAIPLTFPSWSQNGCCSS